MHANSFRLQRWHIIARIFLHCTKTKFKNSPKVLIKFLYFIDPTTKKKKKPIVPKFQIIIQLYNLKTNGLKLTTNFQGLKKKKTKKENLPGKKKQIKFNKSSSLCNALLFCYKHKLQKFPFPDPILYTQTKAHRYGANQN